MSDSEEDELPDEHITDPYYGDEDQPLPDDHSTGNEFVGLVDEDDDG